MKRGPKGPRQATQNDWLDRFADYDLATQKAADDKRLAEEHAKLMSAKLTPEERAAIMPYSDGMYQPEDVERLLASDAERERDCKGLILCLREFLCNPTIAGSGKAERADEAIAKAEGLE